MTEIFVFGTLCHPPLLRAVAGADLAVKSAVLPDAAVARVVEGSWPMLVERTGVEAQGLLIDVADEALARLDYYEACFDYHRTPITVLVEGAPRVVEAWRPAEGAGTPGPDWSLVDWAAEWGAMTVLAAEDVMRKYPTVPPSEVAHLFWMVRGRAQANLKTRDWHRPGAVGHGFGRDDVELLHSVTPYSRFFEIRELTVRHRRFDGTMSQPRMGAVFRVGDAVTVLPYDPARDCVLLIEQMRYGVFAHGDPAPWLLEPVAGMIDAGEGPEDTAHRESHEEAGLTLDALHFIARYYPSPGGVSQVLHSFIGITDLPQTRAGLAGLAAEGEDIRSHIVPFDQAAEMVETGDAANAPLVISLQWLQLHRDRLRTTA